MGGCIDIQYLRDLGRVVSGVGARGLRASALSRLIRENALAAFDRLPGAPASSRGHRRARS